MIQPKKWFERKFSHGMPAWMFPNVIERLRGLPARLEMQIGLLPPRILTWRENEKWPIQEHVGHLLDLEEYDENFVQKPALHPRLQQPMNVGDLAIFAAEHDDHHIAAMTALMRKFSKTAG